MSYSNSKSIIKISQLLIQRHLRLLIQSHFTLVISCAFFIISTSLLSIIVGDRSIDHDLLHSILVLMQIFTTILSSDAIIADDYNKGFLDQILLTKISLELILVIKFILHFIVSAIIAIFIYCICYGFIFNMNLHITDIWMENTNYINTFLDFLSFIWYLIPNIFLLTGLIVLVLLFIDSILIGRIKSMLSAIIAIPLLVPSCILSVLSITEHSYMLLMAAILIILTPITILFCSIAIKCSIYLR